MEVRVRIAPSPTGFFHVGTARTALFNYLFARQNKGKFLVRIEDTDIERSEKKYEEDILSELKWLGLEADEEILKQSDRTEIYKKYLHNLVEKNLAYKCFCTKEDLDTVRQSQMVAGMAPKYNGKCAALTKEEIKVKEVASEAYVFRLRVPEQKITFSDLIRGEVTFDGALIGDIVIAKSDENVLYNFAVVVDDYEMKISHVIRGEDHISNTPKQIFIGEALGFSRPQYAHLPLILDSKRAKLSKRFAAVSVADYREQGYLPEPFLNFLGLLGWHPKEDREILSALEMIAEFNLERVQKGGAIFNVEKLDWLNQQYIKNLSNEKLLELLGKEINEKNLKIIDLVKERLVKLSDYELLIGFFFAVPDYERELLVWKDGGLEKAREVLEKLLALQKLDKESVMALCETFGNGPVLWPLRVALSGSKASPGPFEILEVLGEGEARNRLQIAYNKI